MRVSGAGENKWEGSEGINMKPLLFVTILLGSSLVSAEIYKWVDEEGVTHFGRKPNGSQSARLDIKESGVKPIPEGAQEFADAMVAKGFGDSNKIDCTKAVSNALSGLNSMIEVGAKNYRDGYTQKREYDKAISDLRKIKSEISVSKCKSSSGAENLFYKCITNEYNHVAHCGKKYMSK